MIRHFNGLYFEIFVKCCRAVTVNLPDNVITWTEGAELRFRRCVFFSLFLFLSVSHLNMQESFAFVWAWSRVKAIYIDGGVVSTSDSESVGWGSIPGGRISNFFFFFPFFFFIK